MTQPDVDARVAVLEDSRTRHDNDIKELQERIHKIGNRVSVLQGDHAMLSQRVGQLGDMVEHVVDSIPKIADQAATRAVEQAFRVTVPEIATQCSKDAVKAALEARDRSEEERDENRMRRLGLRVSWITVGIMAGGFVADILPKLLH